jgi:hypothetical protein
MTGTLIPFDLAGPSMCVPAKEIAAEILQAATRAGASPQNERKTNTIKVRT